MRSILSIRTTKMRLLVFGRSLGNILRREKGREQNRFRYCVWNNRCFVQSQFILYRIYCGIYYVQRISDIIIMVLQSGKKLWKDEGVVRVLSSFFV